jgi:hypothetical protein
LNRKQALTPILITILILSILSSFVVSAQEGPTVPKISFVTPGINNFMVSINGGVDWKGHTPVAIYWDWGDQNPVVWVEGYFINNHVYADTREYTITVKAVYDIDHEVTESIKVYVGNELHSGIRVTIDNTYGHGDITFFTSITEGVQILNDGGKTTFYLAEGDMVSNIRVTPDIGYPFSLWSVDESIIAVGSVDSNPIDIVAKYDFESISPNFGPYVFLYPAAVDGNIAYVNGGVNWDPYNDQDASIFWNWERTSPEQEVGDWEESFFPNYHEYTDYGVYVLSVRAVYWNGISFESTGITTQLITLDGSQHGGFELTIDNSADCGYITYISSFEEEGRVESGETVTLYLPIYDSVDQITVYPYEEEYAFDYWELYPNSGISKDEFNQFAESVSVLAMYPSETVTAHYKPYVHSTRLELSFDPTQYDSSNPQSDPIMITGSLINDNEYGIGEAEVILSYETYYDIEPMFSRSASSSGIIATVVTDEDGSFECEWRPDSLPSEEYLITATYEGDETHEACSVSTFGRPLFVVPEYAFGALAAFAACIAAFAIYKKRAAFPQF